MNKSIVKTIIESGNIEWRKHSLEKMFERGISRNHVIQALKNGEIIEDYSEDLPYPSALFYYLTNNTPLHVVAAFDETSHKCFIITAYYPNDDHFEKDFKTRRKNNDK